MSRRLGCWRSWDAVQVGKGTGRPVPCGRALSAGLQPGCVLESAATGVREVYTRVPVDAEWGFLVGPVAQQGLSSEQSRLAGRASLRLRLWEHRALAVRPPSVPTDVAQDAVEQQLPWLQVNNGWEGGSVNYSKKNPALVLQVMSEVAGRGRLRGLWELCGCEQDAHLPALRPGRTAWLLPGKGVGCLGCGSNECAVGLGGGGRPEDTGTAALSRQLLWEPARFQSKRPGCRHCGGLGPVLGPGDFWTDVPDRACARPVAPVRPAHLQGLHPHIWPLAAGIRAAGGRGRDDPPALSTPLCSSAVGRPSARPLASYLLPAGAAALEPGLWAAGPDQPGFLRGAGGAGGPWPPGVPCSTPVIPQASGVSDFLSLAPSFRRLLPHSLCHLQCPSLRLWCFLVNPGPLRPPPPTPQAGTWPGRLYGILLVWSGQHPGALQATCSCWRTHLSVLCVGLLFSPQASSEGHLPERPPHGPTPIYSSSQHPSLAITSPVHLPRTGGPEGRGHAGLVSSVPIGCRGRGGRPAARGDWPGLAAAAL
ncbi:uncharacterized protein [Delphinus delphis]|uniref:uncharacterized protein n=1 Tax=Delphinus delphis TaxID=9728 RepID=UPI0037531F5F